MKSFLILTIFCTFALGLTVEFKLNKNSSKERRVPFILNSYQADIKSRFKRPEYANLLMSFLFGAKQGISPHTKKAFEKTNLSFLLTPSGVHLTSFFLVLGFLLKKIPSKKIKKYVSMVLLIILFFLPSPENIKRLSLLRFSFHGKQFIKKRISALQILLVIFGVSFLLGHYHKNPLSYLISLLYIGTFFTLGEQSRGKLILALFSNQVLVAVFLGNKVSIFSIFTSILGVALFALIQPIFILYFLTYWIYPSNWIEILIHFFIKTLKLFSVIIHGTFTSSSIFLLSGVWILLFVRRRQLKLFLFALSILLHSNTSMSPCIFRP